MPYVPIVLTTVSAAPAVRVFTKVLDVIRTSTKVPKMQPKYFDPLKAWLLDAARFTAFRTLLVCPAGLHGTRTMRLMRDLWGATASQIAAAQITAAQPHFCVRSLHTFHTERQGRPKPSRYIEDRHALTVTRKPDS